MARRRDSKGRFVRSGGKRRGRKRRRGVGSIITVRKRRGTAGLGAVGMDDLLPTLVGSGLTALTALSLRYFVTPNGDSTKQMLVKYAPLFGVAAGALGSLALYMMSSADAAVRAFAGSVVVGGFGFGSDMLLQGPQGPQIATAISSSTTSAIDSTANGTAGYLRGMGAIVPEYSRGMGAIVMEPVGGGSGNRRPGTIGSYGETVNLGSLSGVNTNAFGTPGFSA